jgi:Glyoxalase-like domain
MRIPIEKMRAFALFAALVLPIALAAADLKIDHVTVAGEHLETMRKALTAAAGVPTEYGGPHSNHATEMALVSFPDGSYLELMGIQAKPDPAAVAAHDWSKFLENNAGPCAFALRVTDISAEVRQLKSAGIATGAAETAGRTRPDGTKLVWQTLNVGPGRRGSLFPFLIADMTPRENRAYPSGKPTTNHFGGIAKVVVGVHDLEGAIAQYRKAFHLTAPLRQKDAKFGADLAWFEGTPIVLAQGVDDSSWLSQRVREYGDAPVAFILTAAADGVTVSPISVWFGRSIVWADDAKLGWRLGFESF